MPASAPWGLVCEPERIPEPLQQIPQWCVWSARPRAKTGKWDKIPCAASGAPLSTTDLLGWQSFEDAKEIYRASQRNGRLFSGLGINLSGFRNRGLLVVDLDECVQVNEEYRLEWTNARLEKLASELGGYQELSPSGQGVRIAGWGRLSFEIVDNEVGVEAYDGRSARFLTFTGQRLAMSRMGLLNVEALDGFETINQVPRAFDEVPNVADIDPPDVEDLGIPPAHRQWLLEEFPATMDRSRALAQVVHELKQQGLQDVEVLALLCQSPGAMAVAKDHWRGEGKAELYLWRHHVEKAFRGGDAFEMFDAEISTDESKPKGKDTKRRRVELDNLRLEDIPPREWLIPHMLLKRYLTVLGGRGGSAKSILSLSMCISLSSGQDFLGLGVRQQRRCIYVNNEDDVHELTRRVYAICTAAGIEPASLKDHLDIVSGYDNPVCIATRDMSTSTVIPTKDAERIVEHVKSFNADLLVLDPFLSFHHTSENSNEEQNQVVGILRRLAGTCDCAVQLVHHFRKGVHAVGDWDAIRGAAALTDAARIALTMQKCPDEVAQTWHLSPDEAARLLVIGVGKENFSLNPDRQMWLRLGSVSLMQGDQVGVLERTDPVALQGVASVRKRIRRETDEAEACGRIADAAPLGSTLVREVVETMVRHGYGRRTSERAVQTLPTAMDQGAEVDRDGELFILWRERTGTHKTAPQVIHKIRG